MTQPNLAFTKFVPECLILGTERANERLAAPDVHDEFLEHTGEVRSIMRELNFGGVDSTHEAGAVINLDGKGRPGCNKIIEARKLIGTIVDDTSTFVAPTDDCPFGVLVLERAKLAVIVAPISSTEEQIEEYVIALSASIDDLDALNEM